MAIALDRCAGQDGTGDGLALVERATRAERIGRHRPQCVGTGGHVEGMIDGRRAGHRRPARTGSPPRWRDRPSTRRRPPPPGSPARSALPAGRRRRRPWTAPGRPRSSSSRQARNRRGGGLTGDGVNAHHLARPRGSPAGRGQRAPATWASCRPPRRCPRPGGRSAVHATVPVVQSAPKSADWPFHRFTAGHVEGAGGRAVAGEVTFDAHLDVLLVVVGAVLDVGLVDGEAAVPVHPGLEPCRAGRRRCPRRAGRRADRRPGSAGSPHDRRDQIDAQTQSLLGLPHET